jgi:hypothetical protein
VHEWGGWCEFESYWAAPQENVMVLDNPLIIPVVALVAGILVLIMPRLLNYIVAIVLILYGLKGLNEIYKFINF